MLFYVDAGYPKQTLNPKPIASSTPPQCTLSFGFGVSSCGFWAARSHGGERAQSVKFWRSMVILSGVIGPRAWVITIVTLLITLPISTQVPPSTIAYICGWDVGNSVIRVSALASGLGLGHLLIILTVAFGNTWGKHKASIIRLGIWLYSSTVITMNPQEWQEK